MVVILRFAEKLNYWVGHTICYLLMFMAITGSFEVMMRYFFNRPTIWVWELNSLLLCAMVSLGAGFTLSQDGHVRVDVLYGSFPARTRAILDVLTSIFMFLFLGALLYQTGKMSLIALEGRENSNSIFGPPIYIFKVLLTMGVFLFLLQGSVDFIRSLYMACTGRKLE